MRVTPSSIGAAIAMALHGTPAHHMGRTRYGAARLPNPPQMDPRNTPARKRPTKKTDIDRLARAKAEADRKALKRQRQHMLGEMNYHPALRYSLDRLKA